MNNHYAIPPERDIAFVMLETGMDRMQAIYHLRGRALLRQMPDRRFHDLPVARDRRGDTFIVEPGSDS